MPRINISEVDDTLTTSVEQLYNVVYVPGFSASEALEPRTPVTITDLTTFKRLVKPASFLSNQAFPNGFEAHAISGIQNEYMFNEGEVDPSYTYAYSLIKEGVPVVYERVNTSIEDYECSVSTADPLYIGFKHGTSNPNSGTPLVPTNGTSNPNSGTPLVPTNPTASKDKEYYLQITIDSTGSEPTYTTNLFLYKGLVEGVHLWKEITNLTNYTEDVTLDKTTTPVSYTVTKLAVLAISVNDMYTYLSTRFKDALDNPLYDRNATQIKYLTTGGYPVFEYTVDSVKDSIVKDMLDLANPNGTITADTPQVGRGDCVVLIDHVINEERPLTGEGSVFYDLNTAHDGIAASWGAMFSPGIEYDGQKMVGSFAYLISMAKAVQTNPNWLAVAGVNRGVIPGATRLLTNKKMTRAIADSYMVNSLIDPNGTTGARYSIFINPITNVRPYGLTIWGNRTLIKTAYGSEQALYYLNMRSLLTEIKKQCYAASEQLMFEQNSDVLWINFKSKIVPLLDNMSSSYGISGYKIIKDITDKKAQLKATIKVYPIYAVEDFDITVVLTDGELSVEENS